MSFRLEQKALAALPPTVADFKHLILLQSDSRKPRENRIKPVRLELARQPIVLPKELKRKFRIVAFDAVGVLYLAWITRVHLENRMSTGLEQF